MSQVIGPDVTLALPYTPGGFGTIVADPPWRFSDQGSRAAPSYSTLALQDIVHMPIESIAAERAHLYLWVPSALLRGGLAVVQAWGFRMVATMVWVKMGQGGAVQIGMGHYVRNAHELVLIGERGGLTASARDVPSVFFAPRTEHSAKPAVFFDLVARMSPPPRLELFARTPRAGWLAWGNEVTTDAARAAFREKGQG